MRFFGGYRYHRDTRMTALTGPMRSQRFLRILVALALHDTPDGAAVERHLHLVGHAERDGGLVETGDRPVNPAARDHAVPALDGGEQHLAVLPLLLLRANEQKVKDREDGAEEDDLGEDGVATGPTRRGGAREHEFNGGESHESRSSRRADDT